MEKEKLMGETELKQKKMELEIENQRQEAEMKEAQMRLRMELEMLQLEAEISAAAAEEETLLKHMADAVGTQRPVTDKAAQQQFTMPPAPSHNGSTTLHAGTYSRQQSAVPPVVKHTSHSHSGLDSSQKKDNSAAGHIQKSSSASNVLPTPASTSVKQAQVSTLNPLAPVWRDSKVQYGIPDMQPDVKSASQLTDIRKDQARSRLQSESVENISSPEVQVEMHRQLLDAISLPKTSMMTFDGDPMNYWLFVNAFDSCVDSSSINDGAKLNRLFEYCTGKAAKVIKPCALMQPSEGYQRARKLFHDRFGNDFRISEAWIHKVTDGAVIRPNNGAGLQDFADDVRSCTETLKAMGRLNEIDSRVRMVKIVERLPFYLQSRWRKEAVGMKAKSGMYPNIENLVEFLDRTSNEMNDPVFGTLHKEPKPKPKTRKHGTSFTVQAS